MVRVIKRGRGTARDGGKPRQFIFALKRPLKRPPTDLRTDSGRIDGVVGKEGRLLHGFQGLSLNDMTIAFLMILFLSRIRQSLH